MASIDMIEVTLSSPLDWGLFEKVCAELLAIDDLPRLRRLGGYGDKGLDAVQEAFYGVESGIDTAVQVTSQKAQRLKVDDTLEKLRRYGLKPKRLVVIFRDPCESAVRREIQAKGVAAGTLIDVRDRSYLVQQLARSDSQVFARHFATDLNLQVRRLLEKPDVLTGATDALKVSVLASVAAYSLHPHARLVKGKLLERTVLAIVAESPTPLSRDEVANKARRLLPEQAIDDGQIASALASLHSAGDVDEEQGSTFRASQTALLRVGKTLLAVQEAYADLQEWILAACRKGNKIDDATAGYIERNIRDAVSLLIRMVLPAEDGVSAALDKSTERELARLLSRNTSESMGRLCLTALAGYVEDKGRRGKLAPFVRAYRTLAIRNIDPLGKQWQSAVVARSQLALDTDAVLKLIVADLPEHEMIKAAITSLANDGLKVIVSEHVLDEAVGHIERSQRTYNKFKDVLRRLPTSSVDANVWHAVVRGYAYACLTAPALSWEQYLARYLDSEDPAGYVQRIIQRRAPVHIEELYDIPEKDLPDLSELSQVILQKKEQSKLKAEFRVETMMAVRVEADLRMLFCMSFRPSSSAYTAKGYLATEDRSLFFAEQNGAWRKRPRVAMMTRTLPELASLICGMSVDSAEVVRLTFEPLTAATAELMRDDINALAAIGAEMQCETLDQLEWKLEKGLRKKLHDFVDADKNGNAEKAQELGLDLLHETQLVGIPLSPVVAEVAANYKALEVAAKSDKAELDRLKASLQEALYEVAGESGKAKTRANRMLRSLGLDPANSLNNTESEN